MPDVCGNQQFFAGFRMVDPAADLEFHGAVDNHDKLVGIVCEVFPTLAGRVNPKPATEAATFPILFHFLSIHGGWYAIGDRVQFTCRGCGRPQFPAQI